MPDATHAGDLCCRYIEASDATRTSTRADSEKRGESSGKEQHSEPLEYVACRHVGDWGVGGEEEVRDGGNEDGVVFGSRLLVAD